MKITDHKNNQVSYDLKMMAERQPVAASPKLRKVVDNDSVGHSLWRRAEELV